MSSPLPTPDPTLAADASWFDNRSLFSDHYLSERLPTRPEWREDVSAAWQALRARWAAERHRLPAMSEAQLEAEWVQPVLREVLGWHFEVQTPVTGVEGHVNRPDYSLFTDDAAKRAAQEGRGDERAYYTHAAAIAEAKYWGRPLDRKVATRSATSPTPIPASRSSRTWWPAASSGGF